MKCLESSAIDAAERFVWLSGRLLDRHRFAYLFRDGDAAPVLAALRAYQNADGGFGHALEPDIRAPISQPQPVEMALHVLDELGAFGDPMVGAACDYLQTVTTPDGGVPFTLPSAKEYPHGFWWATDDPHPPASLNPTAAIAGLLHGHAVRHPWLERATAFCWDRLEQLERTDGYEIRCVMLFLEHVPDRARAEAVLARVGRMLLDQGQVALDPAAEGDVFSPLDLATEPGRAARRLFADAVIDAHLDALVDRQAEDGGWRVRWQTWTPVTDLEWRAVVTIEALHRLRAYGRWA